MIKKKDILLIALTLLAALGLTLAARFGGGNARSFVVTIDGEEVLRKPLSADGVYPIRQDDGSLNIVAVESGAVYMQEANCRDGLCVSQGSTRSCAKSIVCLPHGVVVQLEDTDAPEETDDVDIIIF